MTIKQTVDIPASHRLVVDVPREAPAGRAILYFTPEAEKTAQDDITQRLNQYYAGRSPVSDNGVKQAAYNLFAQADW